MIVYYSVSLVSILFAFLARYRSGNGLLALSFIIITVFLSLGYEWGNDVAAYENYFHIYNDSSAGLFDFKSYEDLNQKSEFGWVLINQICSSIGFYWMRAILFCLENYIIYRFVARHVPRKWFWLALFVYTINPNFMALSSSMMRQWLAMCLVVLGFEFLNKKRWPVYVLLLLLASTIHRSSLICLLCLTIPYMRFNNTKRFMVVLIPLFAVYFFLSSFLVDYVVGWLNTEDIYTNYTSSFYSSGVGFLSKIRLVIYLFMFPFVEQVNKEERKYLVVLLFYGLMLPLYNYSGLASRLGYYFTLFTICAYPIFLGSARMSGTVKAAYITIVSIVILYSNIIFFANPLWFAHYGNYVTLFDAGIIKL